MNSAKGIFYSPEIVKDINYVNKNNMPTETLGDTISFMKENIYNFQPALEMIVEMYKKKLSYIPFVLTL